MLVLTRAVGQRVFLGKKYAIRCTEIHEKNIIVSVFNFADNAAVQHEMSPQDSLKLEEGVEVRFLKYVDKRQVCMGFEAPRGMAILRDNIKHFRKDEETKAAS